MLTSSLAVPLSRLLVRASAGWLLVLGGVVVLGALLRGAAHGARSQLVQYAGLGAYVLLLALAFVPLLVTVEARAPGVLRSAAVATALGFASSSALVFTSRRDFSFLAPSVRWGLFVGLLTIIAAVSFGFTLGAFFCVAMLGVGVAAALLDTSNLLHHARENSYVAASLELFATIALMFWFALQLCISGG